MSKELYLYAPIYSFVAEGVISQLNDNMGKSVTLRTLTPGGYVLAAYGIYAKMKEHGNVHLKVDGAADSAGSFLPFYSKSAECLNVSRFTFHKADLFVENEDEQKELDRVNADLKAQMKAVIKADKWLQITGITIDQFFDPASERKDYVITGDQALEIGLVQKVNPLTPQDQKEIAAINNKFYNIAAEVSAPSTMTKQEIKDKYPSAYKEIFTAGVKRGENKEFERVEAIAAFIETDPKGACDAIKTRKPITAAMQADFFRKEFSKGAAAKLEEEAPGAITTDPKAALAKTEREKELLAFKEGLTKHSTFFANKKQAAA